MKNIKKGQIEDLLNDILIQNEKSECKKSKSWTK